MSAFGDLSESDFEDLRNVFYCQARETVDDLQDLLLALEAAPEDGAILKAIKRHIHTLKGDSNSIGLTSLGTLCHSIEDIISSLIDGSKDLKHECIDLLLGALDLLSNLLRESETGAAASETSGFMKRIAAFLEKNSKRRGESPGVSPDSRLTEYQELQIREAIRDGLQVYELEIAFDPMCADRASGAAVLIQKLSRAGQMICSSPDVGAAAIEKAGRMNILVCTQFGIEEIKKDASIAGITGEIRAGNWRRKAEGEHPTLAAICCPGTPSPNARSKTLRIETSRVDKIMELTGELIIGRSMIEQAAKDLEDGASRDDIVGRLIAANSHMERTVADLQKGVMKMRMVPINHVFRKFPKIIRDLCAEKGKMARLDMQGKETELDKEIVDALGEPLAHIFRNVVDHGIEEPLCRKSAGKPEEGVVTLNAYHEAAQIVIEVADDGKGIDRERIKRKAIEKGLLTGDEGKKLSDHEAVNLIFLSGLSTSETVSETSGRGVGMDAVKSAVEAMKGSIEVESTQGEGTTFRLRLPLTLAVIRGLLFEVGRKLYALPVSAVTDVTRVVTDDLVPVDGRDTFLLRDRIISVIRLHELFNIDRENGRRKFILTIGIGNKKIGILVDRIKGEQELVIKAVDDWYMRSGLVTGASILGDGRVVLILDAPAMFRKAVDDERKRTVTA
jgi:two-component system chemotaxis sensor kinase CheA